MGILAADGEAQKVVLLGWKCQMDVISNVRAEVRYAQHSCSDGSKSRAGPCGSVCKALAALDSTTSQKWKRHSAWAVRSEGKSLLIDSAVAATALEVHNGQVNWIRASR